MAVSLDLCFSATVQTSCWLGDLPRSPEESKILIRQSRRYKIYCNFKCEQVPMVAQPKARTVFNHSNAGIVNSNPARGMDMCPRLSVLCCPV